MAFEAYTLEVLRAVEESTGRPVVVRADPSLGTLQAKLTMARGPVPAHVIAYNPMAGAVDYVVCSQCGFLLRMFQTPEAERFTVVGSEIGRKNAESLVADHLRQKGSSYPKELQVKLVEQFFGGIVRQLRSMPIGLRIDDWLQRKFPGIVDQQRASIERQVNDNTTSLRPEIRQFAPPLIHEANLGMNAAFALFWSRTWNDPLLTVPYKAVGSLRIGEALLKRFDEVPDDPVNDKKLIDAWG